MAGHGQVMGRLIGGILAVKLNGRHALPFPLDAHHALDLLDTCSISA
ncbi:MAG: hypothetical protein U0694_00725 [Anaerolineae bacterium]